MSVLCVYGCGVYGNLFGNGLCVVSVGGQCVGCDVDLVCDIMKDLVENAPEVCCKSKIHFGWFVPTDRISKALYLLIFIGNRCLTLLCSVAQWIPFGGVCSMCFSYLGQKAVISTRNSLFSWNLISRFRLISTKKDKLRIIARFRRRL